MHKLLLLLTCSWLLVACNKRLGSPQTNNSTEAIERPYLILISLDGYRWDYTDRFSPPNLSEFIRNGVEAESLVPCFPSKTFPNHYSIATGMYPDHHGLVDNSFYEPDKDAEYRINKLDKVEDGSWYGGTPIWVQAARAGMVTASYFFVGTEAAIQGIRPTYYHNYDGSITNEERISTALGWLRLPEKQRPHFIALYFSDMDDAGHRHGPNDDEKLYEALFKLDEDLGKLFRGVRETKLPVNIIIVSDHGMLEVPVSQIMPAEMLENDELYRTVNNGALAHLYLKDKKQIPKVLETLRSKAKNFSVYPTSEVPYFETKPANDRWGDLIVIPDPGYYFHSQRVIGLKKAGGGKVNGEHGYDPGIRDMHGIFYANGPHFEKGKKIASIKNIHVYPLMCEILGLKIPREVDGKAEALQEVLWEKTN